MQIVIRLFLYSVNLVALAATACAQEPVASPNEKHRLAVVGREICFLTYYGEDLHIIDLIDKKSGKNCNGLTRRIRAGLITRFARDLRQTSLR